MAFQPNIGREGEGERDLKADVPQGDVLMHDGGNGRKRSRLSPAVAAPGRREGAKTQPCGAAQPRAAAAAASSSSSSPSLLLALRLWGPERKRLVLRCFEGTRAHRRVWFNSARRLKKDKNGGRGMVGGWLGVGVSSEGEWLTSVGRLMEIQLLLWLFLKEKPCRSSVALI